MEIQRSSFASRDIEQYGAGAGIIPIALSPHGEFHLLLGRERFLPQWKGSCRWSGFEGSRKNGESIKTTAVREFKEESLCVVSADMIHDSIMKETYWVRVVLKIVSDKRAERYHATYVVVVPWDTSVSTRFAHQRASIEHVDHLAREMERLFPTFALTYGREVEVGDVDSGEDGGVTLHRFVGNESDEGVGTRASFYTRCQEVVCEEEVSDDDDAVSWETREDDQTLVLDATHPYTPRLRAWETVRQSLEVLPSSHVSIVRRTGVHTGRLQDIRVQCDHMEKDQIRWWSVSDLRRVLDNRGFLGNDCFRPYFLPVLQTVLHELSHDPPPLCAS